MRASAMSNNERMPAVFFGHGSPMNVLGGGFSEVWRALGAELPTPRAILMMSAHWYVAALAVTADAAARTIHDFQGFPQQLHQVQYPAPGADWLIERISDVLAPLAVERSQE